MQKIKRLSSSNCLHLIFIFSILIFLQGCASSCLSRIGSRSIDNAYFGLSRPQGEFDIANNYQNTTQRTKGVVFGGIAGGMIGGITNGIGVLAGSAVGAIFGGAIGAYIDSCTTLVDKLRNRGVLVFVLGDQVMIVLPKHRFFHENSFTILYSSYSTLDLVALLIGNYINISVKVSSFTNDTGNYVMDCALSQKQAENIVKYLWKRGVNTRLIFASGRGSENPVTRNTLDWENDNNRIEITMEKLPG